MIEASVVLAKFAALADIPTNDTDRLLPLAQLCITRLYAQLKPEASSAEHEEALSTVAAGMLLYQNAAITHAGQGGSFKLGDFSLTESTSGSTSIADARALKDELFASIAPLLLQGEAFILQVN